MFDLFRSREKSTRYLLGGLLMLVALSMVITLIPGFGGGSMSSGANDQVIAEIGKDVVTLREVQMSLNDTLRGKQIPNELISIYAPQIINQVISERAMAYFASEFGYSITDADVADVIQRQVPQLFEGGKFVGKEAYAQFLASNNTSISEYERRARLLASMRRLQGAVLEGMVVTPQDIEKEFKSRFERATVDYAKIDPAKIRTEIKVTPEEINAHWATSKTSYRIPEKRGFRMLVVDEAKIAETIQANEADLRKVYDENKDSFRTPERVKARHILIKTQDKPKEQEEALKKKAEDLLKQIKGGADFAELAKKNSEDPGSAIKGGELDWYPRGQLAKAFEDSAFSMQPKQMSDVVKTEFGFHIIQTLEKENARLKPFEEVKADIAKEQSKQLVFDRMQAVADQANAALKKDPANAEQIAQQLNASYYKIEKASAGDPLPLIGTAADFTDALSQLKAKNEVTGVVQVPSNRLVMAVLDEIFPARQAELAEVQDQIKNTITSERAQRLLAERSAALMEKVKSLGGDLRKAAAAMNLEVKSTGEFGREGQAEGIGPASLVDEAFRRDVGAVFGPVNASGANVVCKVTAKIPADLSKLPEQRFDLLLKLKGKKAQERRDLFEDGLMQHLKAKGIVKIHNDTVKRLVDSFKSS
jgi:peptidyl-prolyl cis-trans isomerase D